jgi:hypothetical protein
MGGVELFDQMTSFSAVVRRVYCWPIVFLYNFLETAATNSFILYKQINKLQNRNKQAYVCFTSFKC